MHTRINKHLRGSLMAVNESLRSRNCNHLHWSRVVNNTDNQAMQTKGEIMRRKEFSYRQTLTAHDAVKNKPRIIN